MKHLFFAGLVAVVITMATTVTMLQQDAEAGPIGMGIPCFAGSAMCVSILDNGDAVVVKDVKSDRTTEAVLVGNLCPQAGRTDVLPTVVLGTTQSQWTSLSEGTSTAFVFSANAPVNVLGMFFGKLQVSATEVLTPDSVFPRTVQNATWRCGSSGTSTTALPTVTATATSTSTSTPTPTATATATSTPTGGTITTAEVQGFCANASVSNNCAGTYTSIEGGRAVKFTASVCRFAGGSNLLIPNGVQFQLANAIGMVWDTRQGAQTGIVYSDVCEATFRR